MRIGIGYDVHRLVPGRKLILGGIEIAHDRGLDGHSDADVLVHAIMDALLGAAALGDIGQHFSPHEAEFAGISSLILLDKTATILKNEAYEPVQIDAVVMCEQPQLKDRIIDMRKTIAGVLGLELSDVSVKATTTEGLGPVGRQEGIAAQAVATVEKVSSG